VVEVPLTLVLEVLAVTVVAETVEQAPAVRELLLQGLTVSVVEVGVFIIKLHNVVVLA
jgi:hypothetical protein